MIFKKENKEGKEVTVARWSQDSQGELTVVDPYRVQSGLSPKVCCTWPRSGNRVQSRVVAVTL